MTREKMAASWACVISYLEAGLRGSYAERQTASKDLASQIEHIVERVGGDEGNLDDEVRDVLKRLRQLSEEAQPQNKAKKPKVTGPDAQSKPVETAEPRKPDEYTIHPVALKFPELPAEEFAALKESIRQLGQFDPIIIDEAGVVLDGRHRYQACRELGIQPRTKNFADIQSNKTDKLSAEEFIFDSNMKRRHLTESQRAAIGAEFSNMRQGERTDLAPCNNCDKVSQEKASELLKVSRGSVSRAKKVKAKDPEAFAKVKAGDLSLNAAVVSVVTQEKPVSWSATDNQKVDCDDSDESSNKRKRKTWKIVNPPALSLEVGSEPTAETEAEEHEPKVSRRTRPKRWNSACAQAREAIDELICLQTEYQQWLDSLPENLSNSALSEKLNAIVELSLEDVLSTIEEAEGAELPKGFGRD